VNGEPLLFEEDGETDVALLAPLPVGDEAQWRYEPARLFALADTLRPLLRAGVEPLGAALAALSADEEWREGEHGDVARVARWLAGATRHPRYEGERWRMLLDRGNLDHAEAEARRKIAVPTADAAQQVADAVSFLRDNLPATAPQ
jgi:hypothetical protein